MNRIAILSGQSLSLNPRVLKEAATLANVGYEVVVYGACPTAHALSVDSSLATDAGFIFRSVITNATRAGRLRLLWYRLSSRLACEAYRRFGLETHWQLGPAAMPLLAAAKEERANFYIAHTEVGAWVGCTLLDSGNCVGADFEDWHSEDLPPESRKTRPIRLLRRIERTLVQRAAYVTCPSHAMSGALRAEYGGRPAAVVYNAFPWAERATLDGLQKDRKDRNVPSIHWFSQTLGTDRGLADLLQALPHLSAPVEVHLRGSSSSDTVAWAERVVPIGWRDRVFLHGLVSNSELLSRIAEHDIGFAGEVKLSRSRDVTVTNKILYYLLGGLAVVASDTQGQCEVAAKAPEAVAIYRSGDPLHLAEQLNKLLASHAILQSAKAAALNAARECFSWEAQQHLLIQEVQSAMRRDGREGA